MDKEYSMNEDLCDLMKDFIHWREAYLETHKSYREMHGTIEVLHEELRIARDLERSERYRDASTHDLLTQQQSIIDELLVVKDENIKLSTRTQELENSCNDLKMKLEMKQKQHEEELQNLKSLHSFEINEVSAKADKEVMELKEQLDKNQREFHRRYQAIANKLEELKTERDEQVNLLIAEYEGKLQRSNEMLESVTLENKHIKERASANMSIYQKKLLELEKENADDSNAAYKGIQSSTSHVYQEFKQLQFCGRQNISPMDNQSNLKSISRFPDVHRKEEQQNIKKYLSGKTNQTGMMVASQDGLMNIEMYNEAPRGISAPPVRRPIAFPTIKKKKLFNPSETNLQPL